MVLGCAAIEAKWLRTELAEAVIVLKMFTKNYGLWSFEMTVWQARGDSLTYMSEKKHPSLTSPFVPLLCHPSHLFSWGGETLLNAVRRAGIMPR